MKYNIVTDDGENSSVTAFIGGKAFVATKDQPNFQQIIAALSGENTDEQKIKGLFNTAVGIADKFGRLSERVIVHDGRIYFDGDALSNALTETILKFFSAGVEDFQPLVNFMEKIVLNPNPHSQEHLFRWLEKHDFALSPDGDFIAYKGVRRDMRSKTAGPAIVNAEFVNGNVLNVPDTVVEMGRSQVTFDPSVGCSVGLHAGNWRYARWFGDTVLAVKINPRDVVSVPTDSSDEKLRVCRYRVIGKVDAPISDLLYLAAAVKRTQVVNAKAATEGTVDPDEPVKKPRKQAPKKARKQAPAPAKKAVKPALVKLPRYFEQYTTEQFETLPIGELRWLVRDWEVKSEAKTVKGLAAALSKEATERLKTW